MPVLHERYFLGQGVSDVLRDGGVLGTEGDGFDGVDRSDRTPGATTGSELADFPSPVSVIWVAVATTVKFVGPPSN